MEECGPCPVFAGFTLAFALQLRKKHGKTSVRVRKTSVRLRKTSVSVHITKTPTHFKPPTINTHTHTHTHTQTHLIYMLQYCLTIIVISECTQITPYLYVQPSSCRWTLGFETCRWHQKLNNISLTKVRFVGLYCTIFGQPSHFVWGKYLLHDHLI